MLWRGTEAPWSSAGLQSTHPGPSSQYTQHCGYCPGELETSSTSRKHEAYVALRYSNSLYYGTKIGNRKAVVAGSVDVPSSTDLSV